MTNKAQAAALKKKAAICSVASTAAVCHCTAGELVEIGHAPSDIEIAMAAGVVAIDPGGLIVRTAKPITPDLWLEQPLASKPTEQPRAIPGLTIAGMKLKNEDRFDRVGYYFFVGPKQIAEKAAEHFRACGLDTAALPNGSTGTSMFIIVPLFVTGIINFESEEDHVSTATTGNAFGQTNECSPSVQA